MYQKKKSWVDGHLLIGGIPENPPKIPNAALKDRSNSPWLNQHMAASHSCGWLLMAVDGFFMGHFTPKKTLENEKIPSFCC